MKVFVLKDNDFEDLRNRLELAHLRSHDNNDTLTKIEKSDLFRSFNYQICNWIKEVKR